jgi:dienelactone hydrolase
MSEGNGEGYTEIRVNGVKLEGNLIIPEEANGIVIFAHGSGSSRFSPRNRYVAETIRERGIATLLMDLLTKEEEARDRFTGHLRFDLEFLADRLMGAREWISQKSETQNLVAGYFGSSTGGGAALIADAKELGKVKAVVSRGGRPDLAMDYLPNVKAPTLLIVGGRDYQVLELNKKAFDIVNAEKSLEIVEGATHLFEEPGALKEVAYLASNWFEKYLS